MPKQPDVVLIGGGVIGLISAWMLAKQGLQVHLLERGEVGKESSWAGAGIIPPGNFDHALTSFDRFRAWSSEQFPHLVKELENHTGLSCDYHVCGGIEFIDSPDPVISLWQAEKIAFQEVHNHPKIKFPAQRRGIYFPQMAQIRNPRYLKALLQSCTQHGVIIETNATVYGFHLSGNRVIGVDLTNGKQLSGQNFVLAAGAWSEPFLQQFGVKLNIHPVRGQIVQFAAQSVGLREILIVDKCYLVPRSSGEVLVGSTEEPEAGFQKENTQMAIESLREFAGRLVPELRKCPVIKTWAGLRPGSPDGLPYIGRVGSFQNLIFAGGHFRAGIQLSPATGRLVCDLVLDRPSLFNPKDFALDREKPKDFQASFRS